MTLDTRAPLSMLDSSALCAERGFHVIPVWRSNAGVCTCPRGSDCISPGKHPAIDSWQTAASTDLTVLRDWFSGDRHNIGVVCGQSRIVAIDVDPRNGGNETFAALTAELGPLPATITADSGGGGTHYVFRRPLGELESKLGKGVDLLRDNRQFLVEPSVHPSGGVYRWRADHAPDEIAIATLPEAWLKRIRRRDYKPTAAPVVSNDARIERARRYLAKLPAAVSGDGGHTQTFNAVATVMFGFDLDEGTAYSLLCEYNQRCDPPWSERELKHKIKSCAATCKRERGYLLQADRHPVVSTRQAANISTPPVVAALDETDWTSHLLVKQDGTPKRGYHNLEVFVRYFPDYRGRWALNMMTGEPWFAGSPMRETFVHEIRAHADRRLGFTPPVADIHAAIAVSAEEFHPIQQYLRSIDWDGIPRLYEMARDYLGSNENLHAEMVRRWMIGSVARALAPGCKLDTALMLYGPQGYFKSTFFAILGGEWHSDSAIDIANKDSVLQIHASWLYEFAELENVVTGARESRLKAWLTSTHDTFRAPYKHGVITKPRSCAICGTTNRQQLLTDDTGSRRFWIVPVSAPIPCELLAELRDQLWAEAVAAYEAGEHWWFDADLEIARETANEDFDDEDPWMERISTFVQPPLMLETTVTEVMDNALKLEAARQDRSAQMRVSRVLRKLGWHRSRETGGRRRWLYLRPEMKS